MRMWCTPFEVMCDKHLLGEHVETHMFKGTIEKGKSVQGFIDDGLFDPRTLIKRHGEIAREMKHRRMNHNSPLVKGPDLKLKLAAMPDGKIDVPRNIRELARRCPDCYERAWMHGYRFGFKPGGDKVFERDEKWYVQLTGEELDGEYPNKAKALLALEKIRREMTLKNQGRI